MILVVNMSNKELCIVLQLADLAVAYNLLA